jgi:hypothetical protein
MKMKFKETMASPPVADLVEMLVPIRMVPQSPIAYLLMMNHMNLHMMHHFRTFASTPSQPFQIKVASILTTHNKRSNNNSWQKCYLLQDTWFSDPDCFTASTDSIILDTWDTNEMYFNKIKDPHILAARATSSKLNEDNPSFGTATCGLFQAQFWKAMYDELVTLVKEFDCWDYIPQTPTMKVLPSTWAFKIKCYPNGRVKKFKAQFCTRGDRQTEGVDYFET